MLVGFIPILRGGKWNWEVVPENRVGNTIFWFGWLWSAVLLVLAMLSHFELVSVPIFKPVRENNHATISRASPTDCWRDNEYVYVDNNSTRFVGPTGKQPEFPPPPPPPGGRNLTNIRGCHAACRRLYSHPCNCRNCCSASDYGCYQIHLRLCRPLPFVKRVLCMRAARLAMKGCKTACL